MCKKSFAVLIAWIDFFPPRLRRLTTYGGVFTEQSRLDYAALLLYRVTGNEIVCLRGRADWVVANEHLSTAL